MQTTSTGSKGGRPMILSTRGVVSAGHPLAAEAALAMMRVGGNAFDAAAAAGFALAVTMPHQNGLAGEVPILLYSAELDATFAVSGNGIAPQGATLEAFADLDLDVIPGDGLLPAVVPAVVATWIAVLGRFGTMRLADVLAPAIQLAAGGVVMYDVLATTIASQADRFGRHWPSSAEVFLPGGGAPPVGRIWRQAALARTLRSLARADAGRRRRRDGLRAAHDLFYRGPIARKIDRHCRQSFVDGTGRAHKGFLSADDMASYEVRFEEPVSVSYRSWRVHKCSTWSQGPAMAQTLKLLESYDLAGMGHNSAEYVHTVIECMKLAYADREFRYGDPQMADVPLKRLLSAAYASRWRGLVDPSNASGQLRPGGEPPIAAADIRCVNRAFGPASGPPSGDTTAVDCVDAAGNLISAVQSGGWLQSSPVVEALGCPLGTRGQMFSLAPDHPNCLAPGKRPRTTLTPSLAGRLRRPPHMAFGCPGGDCQDQWALQYFLNRVEFGMSAQEAVEAPTFWTGHWPNSFYPRKADPQSLYIESRVPAAVRADLKGRGHRLRMQNAFGGGNTMAVEIDRAAGVLAGAASPRYEAAYAMGW